MINRKLLDGRALLKVFSGDANDYSAEYDEYALSGVRIVERSGSSPDMESTGAACLYFFAEASVCTDKCGTQAALPRVKYGDRCVIHPGESGEKELRVESAEYRDGLSDGERSLSHVKLTLK